MRIEQRIFRIFISVFKKIQRQNCKYANLSWTRSDVHLLFG